VKTDDGSQYGPVPKAELDSWVSEGRLNSESQLLKEGAAQWQWATDLYPQLDQGSGSQQEANPFDFAANSGGGGGGGIAVSTGGGGYSRAGAGGGQVGNKSKIAAGLLGIFLGGYGVHRFYLGYTSIGIVQILVTIFTCGAGALWGLIEGIMILTGSFDRDADGYLLKD
jgi:TM2 domain-containing membrane protein YozV